MTENDRQLSLALDSDEVRLVEKWLSVVLAEGATLPPLDEKGAVDPNALVFRAGALSVLSKMRAMRAQLEGQKNGTQ